MKSIIRPFALLAVSAAFCAFAQDDEEFESDGEESEAPAAEASVVQAQSANKHRYFRTLPCCRRKEGVAQVLRLGMRDWEDIEEGKYYPLGTAYRTVGKDSRLTIAFGPECLVVIVGEASFGTRRQSLEEKSRAIMLKSGLITVKLPRNLPDGMFFVSAPGFTVKNLAGDSRYRYEKTGDGDRAIVRCVSGTLSIDGLHFSIPSMKAANEVKIRTSQDALFTSLHGTRGDYIVKLDQGLIEVRDPETQNVTHPPKFLEWKMSPQTAVRIHRAVPEIGERMAVTTMTFDAAGAMRNRCAFTEGRYEVNTGELTPTNKGQQNELAKKAAEAADTVAVDADAADAEDVSDGGAEEDSVSDDSGSSDDTSISDDEDLEF